MKVAKGLVYQMIVSMIDDEDLQNELLAELDARPSADQHPLDDMIPVERLNAAHHRLEKISGDEFVSWRFGHLFELDTLGVLGYLWKHSSTLEDMVEHHVKFLGVLMDVVTATFEPVPGGRKIEWTPLPLWEKQDLIAMQREHEAAIGFFCKAIQVMTGKNIKPKSIGMLRKRPSTYPESFGNYIDLITFRAKRHSITFHDYDLRRPLTTFNPHLLKTLEAYASELLSNMNENQDFPAQVEQVLIKNYSGEFLQIDEVAGHFNTSTRNLQRRLGESGASFRQVLNNVKLSMAQVYLKNPSFSVGEVGFLLGYAEPPAFMRFFKKHSGMSPSEFRHKL